MRPGPHPDRRPPRLPAAILALTAVLFAAAAAPAGDPPSRKGLVVEPTPGEARAAGALAFAPGSLPSTDRLRVVEPRAGAEVAAAVRVVSSWPDGSVQLAEVALAVPAGAAPRYFWAEWGPGISRALPAPAAFPGAEASLAEGEVPLVLPDTEIGTMLIRVEPHAALWYWGWLLPIGAVLGLLAWRRARLSRAEAPR